MHNVVAAALGVCLTFSLVASAGAQSLADIGSVDPSEVVIELEKRGGGGCLVGSRCLHYVVRLLGTGSVTFEGRGWMAEAGVHRDQIDSSAAVDLVNEFLGSLFFETEERYAGRLFLTGDDRGGLRLLVRGGVDGIHSSLRISIGVVERSVSGEHRNLPPEIVRLADRVDEVTGTARWLPPGP